MNNCRPVINNIKNPNSGGQGLLAGRGCELTSLSDEVGEMTTVNPYVYCYGCVLEIRREDWVRGLQALLGQRGGHLVCEGGQLRRVGHV